jgi:hypothetical protein
MAETIEDLFKTELRESMKIVRLQTYAAEQGLVPKMIKYNELSTIFWNLYQQGDPYIVIDGKETILSKIQRLKDCRMEVVTYYNTRYRGIKND